MSLVRKIISLGYWILDSEKSLSDFKKEAAWTNEDLLSEIPSDKLISPLVITAHVFYPEFANDLIYFLKQLPIDTKVFATTPSQEIKQVLEAYLKTSGNPHDVRLTPNTGRNFGPLLVEFSKQLLIEESFIHVHSKKSLHTPEIGRDWLKRNTSLLVSRQGLQRITSLTERNPEIGIVYVDASDLFWGMNFRWGRSRRIARNIFGHLPGFEGVKWSGKLDFPAGGMFWLKTEAIRSLLQFDWNYGIFTPEKGERDGTLAHALERLFGEVALRQNLGYEGAVFDGSNFYKVSRNHLLDRVKDPK
jgi:lipopolysaccharide biosynthesis protein